MNNKFSFIQGRLLNTKIKGVLQCYPENIESLKKEFFLASKLGFDSIEIFEPENHENMKHIPTEIDTNFLLDLYLKNKLNFESCTFDPVLAIKTENSYENICKRFSKLVSKFSKTNLCKIILPFVEDACFKRNKFSKLFLDYAIKNSPSNFLLLIESNLFYKDFSEFNIYFKDQNLAFCYDTGNRYREDIDYKKDLTSFGGLIQHVHLKDKSDLNENCILGDGNVPFEEIIRTLRSKELNYSGTYVFECNRGNEPFQNHKKYKKFIKELILN